MSGARVCVTNLVADLRSCTIRGEHRSTCDGWAYRYDPATGQTRAAYRIRWNPDTRENERTLIECAGCLPREAEVGLLCESHVAKMRHALDTDGGTRIVVDLGLHLWASAVGVVSDGNDRVSTSFGSRWPLSESRVVANEMIRALDDVAWSAASDLGEHPEEVVGLVDPRHGLPAGVSLTAVGATFGYLLDYVDARWSAAAAHRDTAESVVRMIDTIQTALHRFPLADSVHRIPAVRCPACGRMSLEWRPPLFHLDEVIVACQECGNRTDQNYVDAYVAAVRTDPRRMARR